EGFSERKMFPEKSILSIRFKPDMALSSGLNLPFLSERKLLISTTSQLILQQPLNGSTIHTPKDCHIYRPNSGVKGATPMGSNILLPSLFYKNLNPLGSASTNSSFHSLL